MRRRAEACPASGTFGGSASLFPLIGSVRMAGDLGCEAVRPGGLVDLVPCDPTRRSSDPASTPSSLSCFASVRRRTTGPSALRRAGFCAMHSKTTTAPATAPIVKAGLLGSPQVDRNRQTGAPPGVRRLRREDPIAPGDTEHQEARRIARQWAREQEQREHRERKAERRLQRRGLVRMRRHWHAVDRDCSARSRPRASRASAPRHRGSRRPGAGSRAGPDDGDPEPPALTPGARRHRTRGLRSDLTTRGRRR